MKIYYMISYPNFDALVETKLNHNLPNYLANHPSLPKNPFRMCLIGASASGKGNLLLNMLTNLLDYDNLFMISETDDGINEYIKNLANENSCFHFYSDVNEFDLKQLNPTKTNLIVFDDICHNSKAQDMISSCFSLGRHHGASIIYLSQSFFKLPVFIRNNSTYFCIFRLGMDSELGKIHDRLASDVSREKFKQMYQAAVKLQPYGFIFINLLGSDPKEKYKNRFEQYFDFL